MQLLDERRRVLDPRARVRQHGGHGVEDLHACLACSPERLLEHLEGQPGGLDVELHSRHLRGSSSSSSGSGVAR